ERAYPQEANDGDDHGHIVSKVEGVDGCAPTVPVDHCSEQRSCQTENRQPPCQPRTSTGSVRTGRLFVDPGVGTAISLVHREACSLDDVSFEFGEIVSSVSRYSGRPVRTVGIVPVSSPESPVCCAHEPQMGPVSPSV